MIYDLFDTIGKPGIEREMTPEQYEIYKKNNADIKREIKGYLANVGNNWPRTVELDISRLNLIYQDSDWCREIPYPAKGAEWKTIGTSGGFLLVVSAVLNYFDRDFLGHKPTLEDLVEIAVYGDWHHPQNGTWHHYVDVVLKAYGLNAERTSELNYSIDCMERSGAVILAMLDDGLFNGIKRNSLVMITKLENDFVYYYHPKRAKILKNKTETFLKHTGMIWVVSDF